MRLLAVNVGARSGRAAPGRIRIVICAVSVASLLPMTPLSGSSPAGAAPNQTVDGLFAGVGALGQAATVDLTVVGRGGVPGLAD